MNLRFIFTNKENIIQKEILKSRGIDMIVSDKDNLNEALKDFFEKLLRS